MRDESYDFFVRIVILGLRSFNVADTSTYGTAPHVDGPRPPQQGASFGSPFDTSRMLRARFMELL